MATMEEMIGAITHQWRQPLNSLALTVQDIIEAYHFGELDETYLQKTVDVAMSNIRFISQTIDDFRNFFWPDKERVVFAAGEIIQEVITISEASFRAHAITVELKSSDQIWIKGYPNELKQIILNILNNAKDAITLNHISKGRIEITLEREGPMGIIRIADNGGGIPEEILNKIFEPYFTTKSADHGTGIGLYISKSIIEGQNGTIEASNTGEGALFTIRLPLEAPPPPFDQAQREPDPQSAQM